MHATVKGVPPTPQGTRKSPIVRGIINFCWFFFKWGLVLGLLVALVGVPYLYRRVDEEIRQHLESKLAEHYPDLTIAVRSARLIKDHGIEIRGVSIAEPGAAGPQTQLAYFEEIFVECRASLPELVQHEPQLARILVRGTQFHCTRRPDGTRSSTQLLPFPKFSDCPPEIVVENGTVEIFDPTQNPSTTMTYHDLNLTISPAVAGTEDAIGSEPLQVQGYFTGEHLRRVDLRGTIADSGDRWRFAGQVDSLELSPEWLDSLPADAAQQLEPLRSIRARTQLAFRFERDPQHEVPLRFAIDGQVVQGRIDDPRLPYSLNDLRATWSCNERGLLVQDLQAKNGQSTVQLSAHKGGYDTNSPWAVALSCRKMVLDRQLLSTAPERWREYWDDFLPAGIVDVDLKVNFDGQELHPEVHVRCLDTSFTYHKLPYRLDVPGGPCGSSVSRCKSASRPMVLASR